MPPLFLWVLVFVFSLGVLVKGSDWFTAAAERLAGRLGISPFVVVVTVAVTLPCSS